MKTLFCLLVLVTAWSARAQGNMAIESFSITEAGFDRGTAGWSFQVLTNVSVTALGCFDYSVNGLDPICLGLWAADGTLLASNTVSTNSVFIAPDYYEPIEPILLFTNQTYYVGAFDSVEPMIIAAYEPDDPYQGGGYIDMAAEIQLGLAVSSSDDSFEIPEVSEGAPGSAIVAPNFQFQDGVVPPVLSISPTSNDVLISWSATYPNFALQENDDLTTTNWMTTTNPIVQVGGQNQVLISLPIENNFYRLESQ